MFNTSLYTTKYVRLLIEMMNDDMCTLTSLTCLHYSDNGSEWTLLIVREFVRQSPVN